MYVCMYVYVYIYIIIYLYLFFLNFSGVFFSDRLNIVSSPFVLYPHGLVAPLETFQPRTPAPFASATLLRHHGQQTEEARLRATLLRHFRLAVSWV